MLPRHLVGALALGLITATTLLGFGCSSDEPAEEACQEGAFQCVGQELQRCTDGAFVMDEMCSEEMPCRAEHGHCHPAGEGGHMHQGGGGHHMGGGGHHMGGMHMGGMHMGGGGMHMGGGGAGG